SRTQPVLRTRQVLTRPIPTCSTSERSTTSTAGSSRNRCGSRGGCSSASSWISGNEGEVPRVISRWLRRRPRRGSGGPVDSGSGDREPADRGVEDGGRGRDGDARWVVVDVEASGLDADTDRLLAIAGVGVAFEDRTPRLRLGDSFEAVLRQEDP